MKKNRGNESESRSRRGEVKKEEEWWEGEEEGEEEREGIRSLELG